MHRAVQTPGGREVDEGDTPILKHSYFKLVTDHYKGYSNLEFVMNHFDQLAGTEPEAIAELGRQITAMSTLAGQLYAGSGRLGTMIGNITPAGGIAQPADIYKALAVRAGSSTDLLIGDMPAGVGPDDGKLYVHYTVGVRPQDWAKMVRDVESVSRPDTHNSRPKASSKEAREIAAAILANATGNPGPWRVEVEGHLALLYMQMGVFIDKCLGSLPHKELKSAFSRATYVRDVDKLAKVNVALKTATRQEKPALTDRKKVLEKRIAKQEDAKAALRGFERYVLPFSEGQQKNKILALPRAPLADAYSMLSERSQRFLWTNQERILDRFTEKLQATMRLDFTENQTLKNKITIGDRQVEVETSLIDYLKAGLGSGQVISQQVLFGDMNEVGVDRTNPNALLLPFEFRKVFGARVTWAELTADATKVLKWSRDPQRSTLA